MTRGTEVQGGEGWSERCLHTWVQDSVTAGPRPAAPTAGPAVQGSKLESSSSSQFEPLSILQPDKHHARLQKGLPSHADPPPHPDKCHTYMLSYGLAHMYMMRKLT